MKQIADGVITREQAIKNIKSVFENWTEKQGVPELGPELVKNIEQRLPKTINVWDSLNETAQTLFNQLKKELSSDEKTIAKLNELANQLNSKAGKIKLTPAEMKNCADALQKGGLQLNRIIEELEANKAFINKIKEKNWENKWSGIKLMVKKFNDACNLLVDAFKGNKITYGAWKIIKTLFVWCVGITLGFILILKAVSMAWDKVTSGVGSFFTGTLGTLWNSTFGGSSTPQPTPTQQPPQPPTPNQDDDEL